jgi:hypothetical protein
MSSSEGRGRLESPASLAASSGQRPKGITYHRRLRLNEFDSCGVHAYLIKAELRGLSLWLGEAYSGEDEVRRN